MVSGRSPPEDAQRHPSGGFSLLPAGQQAAADDALAQLEGPEAVNGDVGPVMHEPQDLFIGEGPSLTVPVEGAKDDQAVVAQAFNGRGQLRHGHILDYFDAGPGAVMTHGLPDAVGDDPAGFGRIADDNHPAAVGMEGEGESDGPQWIGFLHDAGDVGPSGQGAVGKSVQAAEHDGRLGKYLGPVVGGKVEGGIVGGDDHLEVGAGILVAEEVRKEPFVGRSAVTLGIQVFHKRVRIRIGLPEGCHDAGRLFAGPGEAGMVRVQHKDPAEEGAGSGCVGRLGGRKGEKEGQDRKDWRGWAPQARPRPFEVCPE